MFDHVLSCLQSKLMKTRDTGSELRNVIAMLENVGEVLGDSLVSSSPFLLCHSVALLPFSTWGP